MILLALLVGSALALLWLLVLPVSGTDLAAQHTRAQFAGDYPGAAVDLSWFSGVQPAAYSVLSPYVMALLGARGAAALAIAASSGLFGALVFRWRTRRTALAACWGAGQFTLNVIDGRVTFALGVAVALAALVAVPPAAGRPWRWVLTAVLAVLCTLTSPVAALFLALVAFAWGVRRRAVLWVGVVALAPLGLIAALFPDAGTMLDTWHVVWPDLLAAFAVVVFCRGRELRLAAFGYALAVFVVWLHPGPVGSNMERLAVMFTGPALICCWRWHRALLPLALVVVALWTTRVPIRDLRAAGSLSKEVAASHRLVGILSGLGPIEGRIEVVPFADHAESAIVPSAWPLARGWERQVDLVQARALYSGSLTGASYQAWLLAHSVQYVALGRLAHDMGGTHEAALLTHQRPSYLTPVHTDPQWTVWRVDGFSPIVGAPGRLAAATPAVLQISVPGPGVVPVNVRWTRWWRASGGAVVERRGPHLALRVPRAETVTLSSSY